MSKLTYFLFFLILISGCTTNSNELWMVKAPAGDRQCVIDPNGESIIPNGRIIKPYGKTVRVAPHPYGLTLFLGWFNCNYRKFRNPPLFYLYSQKFR